MASYISERIDDETGRRREASGQVLIEELAQHLFPTQTHRRAVRYQRKPTKVLSQNARGLCKKIPHIEAAFGSDVLFRRFFGARWC